MPLNSIMYAFSCVLFGFVFLKEITVVGIIVIFKREGGMSGCE